jgi:hypothetical protein
LSRRIDLSNWYRLNLRSCEKCVSSPVQKERFDKAHRLYHADCIVLLIARAVVVVWGRNVSKSRALEHAHRSIELEWLKQRSCEKFVSSLVQKERFDKAHRQTLPGLADCCCFADSSCCSGRMGTKRIEIESA